MEQKESHMMSMLDEISFFRDQLSRFVELIENMIREGERMNPVPESVGFCEEARQVFEKYLRQIDNGFAARNADHIVHAILRIDSSLGQFTEYNLNWSVLWRRADAREQMRQSTQALIHSTKIVDRESEIQSDLLAGK